MEPHPDYDDIVVGSGMAGLTVGALLADAGRRVLMLEAHDEPGGYAHTFAMGDYRFCAQVHYIFGCGEGEPVHELLRRLGLLSEVQFIRLDPDGFDHVVIGGERFRIPSGFDRFRDRLIERFPEAARPLRRYFRLKSRVRDELRAIPDKPRLADFVTAPVRFRSALRYQRWTLQQVYDRVGMPRMLQGVLAGQAGDYLLPPDQVSFLLHVALCSGYDRGAYYPVQHFAHMVNAIADKIRLRPGCDLLLNHEVRRFLVESKRVVGVETADGRRFHARRFISNLDPATTLSLAGVDNFGQRYRRRVDYSYSSSTFTLYLGVEGIDLRQHGFGAYNVWHYPHADINRIYRTQLEHNDLSDPWLFLSTPTLHSNRPGLAPDGHQTLVVATSASHAHYRRLMEHGRRAYTREKVHVRDRIIDILEERYVPGLRAHLAMKVAGTPLTNERFVRAPFGNAYGAALTPLNVKWPRIGFDTPIENLKVVNATAGYPSVGGTVGSGIRLFEELMG